MLEKLSFSKKKKNTKEKLKRRRIKMDLFKTEKKILIFFFIPLQSTKAQSTEIKKVK